MKQYEKKSLLILAAVIIFMVFFGIGGVPLLDPDEPVYAETAREMILTGDYLSPRIFGDYWYDKPPMYYWLVAMAFHVFGDGEFAARFPAGLMAGGTALMLYFSVTKLFNERAGFWSSLVLASSLMFFYMGKAAVTDTTLLFFMTGALLSFLHKRYWLMYLCCALGTVTKGPIGVVFPGAIIFLYLVFMGQLRQILQMHVIRGLLLYFMVASPWYYAMYTVHGMEFINTFLGFHNLVRFTTPEHASRVTFWYYFPVIILGMFPWTGLLFQSIKASISDSRIDEMRTLVFMHVWWLFVLIFFTICKTKLVSYILPMFPALAILIGWNISRMLQKMRHNTTFYSWMFGSGLLFAVLSVGWVLGGQQLPGLEFGGIVLGVLTVVLGAASLFTLYQYRDIQMAAWIHVAIGAVTMVVAFAFLLPVVADRFSVKTISNVYRTECNPGPEIYVDKFLRPGFMYYAGKPGVEMIPKTNAFAEALRKDEHKYFLVRGLEYRRLLKQQPKPENLTQVAEIGDIYLLEQK